MKPIDYIIHLLISVFLIFGVYQFYFWCQRQRWVKVRRFHFRADEAIPFWPTWAWVYLAFYYPAILYLNLIAKSPHHFNHIVASFLILLFMHMLIFLLFPVETPPHWRTVRPNRPLSERFMRFAQRIDDSTNCFPSMHVSVATLAAIHAHAALGLWAYLFPVVIAISCVFTKQHYLVDLPFGALLGVIAYRIYLLLG